MFRVVIFVIGSVEFCL
uniref:Uncharacterized protein n=1 Tax=Lepeophtheirus salmonis TaxID=72036 RepID=A0A0K2U412_LEPSM